MVKAIKINKPGMKIIMCYFHLKYNIRKRRNILGKYYDKISNMISKLHFTANQLEFNLKILKYNMIWIEKFNLNSFSDYFMKQWVNSAFKFWRVFGTPNGYSSTNNRLERNNRTIKDLHTKCFKLSLHAASDIFKTVY